MNQSTKLLTKYKMTSYVPEPLGDGEAQHILRLLYTLDGQPRPGGGAELDMIADAEPAQHLRGGPRHGPGEQVEELGPRRRRDLHVRRAETRRGDGGLDQLPRGRVRRRELRGAGEVEGHLEDGAVGVGGADGGDGHGRGSGAGRGQAAAEGKKRARLSRCGGGELVETRRPRTKRGGGGHRDDVVAQVAVAVAPARRLGIASWSRIAGDEWMDS